MPKIILASSGGLDSTVLLYYAAKTASNVLCVNFQYGSKHNPFEQEAYRAIMGISRPNPSLPHNTIPRSSPITLDCLGGSSLIEKDQIIPEGHYEEATMRSTVVPGRNLVFISILAAMAEVIGFDYVWLGAHAGDHYIYPDCRPEFIRAADSAVQLSSNRTVKIEAPFRTKTKMDIVKLGLELNVPFQLTRTCYKPQTVACGQCGSCQERLTAFAANGIVDPIEYVDRTILPKRA